MDYLPMPLCIARRKARRMAGAYSDDARLRNRGTPQHRGARQPAPLSCRVYGAGDKAAACLLRKRRRCLPLDGVSGGRRVLRAPGYLYRLCEMPQPDQPGDRRQRGRGNRKLSCHQNISRRRGALHSIGAFRRGGAPLRPGEPSRTRPFRGTVFRFPHAVSKGRYRLGAEHAGLLQGAVCPDRGFRRGRGARPPAGRR